MSEHIFQILFHVLSNEQELLKRTDQKASTLMSTLAVFMVFFIVHYKNIPTTKPVMAIIYMFFAAAFVTILCLLRVLSPRLKNTQIEAPAAQNDISKDMPNPTYFAGISKFKDAEQYRKYLHDAIEDPTKAYTIFANNVYAIGQINEQKHRFFTMGMRTFAAAVFFELVIIMSMYVTYVFPT